MLTSLKIARRDYPRQFWFLFYGLLISTSGGAMIWPFLMIYASEQLSLPLTAVAVLLTINSVSGLISAFFAGPIIDRVGRKGVMIVSLTVNALGYVLLSAASTLPAFIALMVLQGAFNRLYPVAADAMMADIIPAEQRADAYSLMRMSSNVGVAVGPAVGGMLAATSYTIAFFIAAAAMCINAVQLALFTRETLPEQVKKDERTPDAFGGYGKIWADKLFVSFIAAVTLITICAAMMFVLLGVYAKTNFNVPENQYGWIATTNALLVITLQFAVTQQTKRHPPLTVMALGGLLYALGVGSVALGQGFWGFWLAMVVMTGGELILVPTATTFAANRAPADMRGRYMGVYNLTWAVAAGVGPVLGGALNDTLGGRTIWLGAGLAALLGVGVFLWLQRRD